MVLILVLGYKGFDLSALFQGVAGNAVQNEVKYNTDFWSVSQTGSNKGTRTLQAWTPQNPNSDIPMLTAVDANNEARLSTYFIEKGSYLKLRNMQIGYTLPASILERVENAESPDFYRRRQSFTYCEKQILYRFRSRNSRIWISESKGIYCGNY